MNPEQRKEIDAVRVMVRGIRKREEQNLIDTPDNIEDSGEVRRRFKYSIGYLHEAEKCLLEAK